MAEPEHPQEPASEREDRREEPYAAVIDLLGLRTPLRPSEAFPEGIVEVEPVDREPGCVDEAHCVVHGQGEVERRQWPYDY